MSPEVPKLRALLEERSAIVAPGVYDGISARLVASMPFSVAYMSGAAVACSCGLPDVGLTTQTEMVARVSLLSQILDVPLVADADTGFGEVAQLYRTVQQYERAGAAAIQLEDQEFPKRSGTLAGKKVIDAAAFARRIEAALHARRDPETLIIARTDARGPHGFEEAVRRIRMYADAGADAVFLESPQSVDEVMAIPSTVEVPTLFNFIPGKEPRVSLERAREAGYALIILAGATFATAAQAMRRALEEAANGEVTSDEAFDPREFFRPFELEFWEAIQARFGDQQSRTEVVADG